MVQKVRRVVNGLVEVSLFWTLVSGCGQIVGKQGLISPVVVNRNSAKAVTLRKGAQLLTHSRMIYSRIGRYHLAHTAVPARGDGIPFGNGYMLNSPTTKGLGRVQAIRGRRLRVQGQLIGRVNRIIGSSTTVRSFGFGVLTAGIRRVVRVRGRLTIFHRIRGPLNAIIAANEDIGGVLAVGSRGRRHFRTAEGLRQKSKSGRETFSSIFKSGGQSVSVFGCQSYVKVHGPEEPMEIFRVYHYIMGHF